MGVVVVGVVVVAGPGLVAGAVVVAGIALDGRSVVCEKRNRRTFERIDRFVSTRSKARTLGVGMAVRVLSSIWTRSMLATTIPSWNRATVSSLCAIRAVVGGWRLSVLAPGAPSTSMHDDVRIVILVRPMSSAPFRLTPVTRTERQDWKVRTPAPLSLSGPPLPPVMPASAYRSETSADWQPWKMNDACDLGARIVVPGPLPVILMLTNWPKDTGASST